MLKGHLKVARPQRPQSFWDCLHVPQSITTTNSCVVIKLDARKIFTGSTTNADVRSLAVANLVVVVLPNCVSIAQSINHLCVCQVCCLCLHGKCWRTVNYNHTVCSTEHTVSCRWKHIVQYLGEGATAKPGLPRKWLLRWCVYMWCLIMLHWFYTVAWALGKTFDLKNNTLQSS